MCHDSGVYYLRAQTGGFLLAWIAGRANWLDASKNSQLREMMSIDGELLLL
jgi:hypothetical protein